MQAMRPAASPGEGEKKVMLIRNTCLQPSSCICSMLQFYYLIRQAVSAVIPPDFFFFLFFLTLFCGKKEKNNFTAEYFPNITTHLYQWTSHTNNCS